MPRDFSGRDFKVIKPSADTAIAFAYIAISWVLLVNGADNLDVEILDWLDDELIEIFLFVGWASGKCCERFHQWFSCARY